MNFFGKRGQAAMEFLMTYGWAILVVLVVIAALAYFGVLSPSNLLPEKCTFPVSLSCSDFSVSTTGITLVFQNGAGRDMKILSLNASSDAFTGIAANSTSASTNTLRNGNKASYFLTSPTYTFTDTGRDKNRYTINVTYSWLDSPTLTHVITGELLAKKP